MRFRQTLSTQPREHANLTLVARVPNSKSWCRCNCSLFVVLKAGAAVVVLILRSLTRTSSSTLPESQRDRVARAVLEHRLVAVRFKRKTCSRHDLVDRGHGVRPARFKRKHIHTSKNASTLVHIKGFDVGYM